MPAAATNQPQQSAEGREGRAGIHPWLGVGEQLTADVLLDGKVLARLDDTATLPGLKKLPAVVFDLPRGLKRLQLRGSLRDADGRAGLFSKTWTVRDMAPISTPLYDGSRPLIERVRAFVEKTELAEVAAPRLPAGTTAEAAFQQLERRLHVQLPAPLRQLLGEADIQIDDSYFLAPQDLGTVSELLLKGWGYTRNGGPTALDTLLPETVRARYDRSVAVFVEVGDGFGALAWDPAGVTPREPPNTWADKGNPGARPATSNEGVWYWLHQEHIDEPELLLDDNYQPKSAEAALINVFQRFALSQAAYPETEDELVIDSAHPRNLLQLSFDGPKKPRLWFRSYDYHYSLY
ncbi:hypothetical protein GGE16_005303 [Rhizobium leguminosarum]|uniref:Uncharacterized protein n=1 Tax=Rhizobium leguminosarum TaxID=384 RepID=A0AAE2T039_RHILE|nr:MULTISPECIES: hypothetical protein [Rhizobium]MBB4293218.1 hypothetical protein [Rhizobium leguminosarum]MBB4299959.1 hypothetical protein [Rhizobium leguminosarum]MBB4311085.1 hypothetical protein [Rhizobium leguminosarum]MBB4435312.1 hypothetical protein [Rhizobium esperanzae]MBB4532244.1 hypothetical protein [Rhizobium leguminosarum]